MKKIDVEKLLSLGVPENVIASMDPRDGGNITPDGKVLFLDEERMKSKEDSRPLRVNLPGDEGVMEKVEYMGELAQIIEPTGVRGIDALHSFVKGVEWPADSKEGKKYRKIMGYESDGYSGGVFFPLNHQLSGGGKDEIIPIDIVYHALEEAEYIAIVASCICRVARDCEHYPLDLGCIFLDVAGRRVVEAGLARQATLEEAKAHVRRAREVGLPAHGEMQEVEQVVWGLKNDEMNEFRMICFCCPCCCWPMQKSKTDMGSRYTSCGYTTTVNHDKCVGCHKCQSICCKNAISYREDGKCVIDQDLCVGCGFCKEECENGALTLQRTFPMRDSLNDYFVDVLRIDDGKEHGKVAGHYAEQ